jgi:hypothetical protein
MDIVRLSPSEVSKRALDSLGLGHAGIDLFSTEAMAASLRRAASFICPTTRGRLIRSVTEVLAGLPGYDEETQRQFETLLDALIGYGDLLELLTDTEESQGLHLFLGAPAFVRRNSGACLLVGVRPDGAQLVGDDLATIIEYEQYARIVPRTENLDELVASSGLVELKAEQWCHQPRKVTAGALLHEYEARLRTAGPSGDIEGARIVDPSAAITYYRGRWRSPRPADTGTFVARRPQAYGADLWCFAYIIDGNITQLVDLPVYGSLLPGSDEAWRLQAAIDFENGRPQQVRVRRPAGGDTTLLDFFSPLPSWAQRRLDIVGTPREHGRGALFSHGIQSSEAPEELQFLADMLWITNDEKPERTQL